MKTRGVPQISQDIMEKYNGVSVPSVHCISLNEMPIAWVFDRLARIGWVFIGLWICVKPLGMFLFPTPTTDVQPPQIPPPYAPTADQHQPSHPQPGIPHGTAPAPLPLPLPHHLPLPVGAPNPADVTPSVEANESSSIFVKGKEKVSAFGALPFFVILIAIALMSSGISYLAFSGPATPGEYERTWYSSSHDDHMILESDGTLIDWNPNSQSWVTEVERNSGVASTSWGVEHGLFCMGFMTTTDGVNTDFRSFCWQAVVVEDALWMVRNTVNGVTSCDLYLAWDDVDKPYWGWEGLEWVSNWNEDLETVYDDRPSICSETTLESLKAYEYIPLGEDV